MPDEDTNALFARLRGADGQGGIDIVVRNQLVERFWGWLKTRCAHLTRRLPPCVDPGDVLAWGGIGLMKALETFDAARGVAFTTYAQRRVSGAVFDGLREADRRVRQRRRIKDLPATHSLNDIVHEDAEHPVTWAERLPDHRTLAPGTELERQDLVDKLMRGLGPKQRVVLVGLVAGRTQTSLAIELGVHASRVSQLRGEAIQMTRRSHKT